METKMTSETEGDATAAEGSFDLVKIGSGDTWHIKQSGSDESVTALCGRSGAPAAVETGILNKGTVRYKNAAVCTACNKKQAATTEGTDAAAEQEGGEEMATATRTRSGKTQKRRAAPARQRSAERGPSVLDVAMSVLAKKKDRTMRANEIVDKVLDSGKVQLSGKTPHTTVYKILSVAVDQGKLERPETGVYRLPKQR